MARYRPVFVDLWSCDDKFQDYSAYGKLLYIYLITNTHVNECGLYRITYKTISNETEIPRAEVSRLIKEELSNNVSYDDEKNVIFVHKFLKYNGSGNPNLIQKSIDRDRRLIKTTLWKGFDKYYTRDLKPIKNDSEILPSIPIPKGKGKTNKETYGQDELDRMFEKWWKRYPKKQDRGEAKKKWLTNINNGIDPQILEDALTGYINILHNQETDLKYVKHGKTFLYPGNKKKNIPSTWEQYVTYADPKYKDRARL